MIMRVGKIQVARVYNDKGELVVEKKMAKDKINEIAMMIRNLTDEDIEEASNYYWAKIESASGESADEAAAAQIVKINILNRGILLGIKEARACLKAQEELTNHG